MKNYRTQHEFIIWHLLTQGSISSMEAFDGFGCTKLATRISEMKDMGFAFIQKMESAPNRYGHEVHFMRYWLDEDNCSEEALDMICRVRHWHGRY